MAVLGLAAAALFVGGMIVLHSLSERAVRSQLAARGIAPIERLMVGPRPANPLSWEFVSLAGSRLRYGRLSWPAAEIALTGFDAEDARTDTLWRQIAASGRIPGYLAWARFPWLTTEPAAGGVSVVRLLDARYVRQATRGFGGATLLLAPDGTVAAEAPAGD